MNIRNFYPEEKANEHWKYRQKAKVQWKIKLKR